MKTNLNIQRVWNVVAVVVVVALVALAAYHGIDYLLTWNCRHLANANKFDHIRRINTMLGLKTPELVTPPELLGDIET